MRQSKTLLRKTAWSLVPFAVNATSDDTKRYYDVCSIEMLLYIQYAIFNMQLVKEMRRIIPFPSEEELSLSARPLFLKLLKFARQKSRKSPGLVRILQQIPVNDKDVDDCSLTLSMSYCTKSQFIAW